MSEHGADPVEQVQRKPGRLRRRRVHGRGGRHPGARAARPAPPSTTSGPPRRSRQQKAALGRARATWSIILDPHTREAATLKQTGEAWAAAQAWRADTPDADRASDLAEDRLRVLRPVAMDRYDRLRAEGHSAVDAMWQVAPLMDRPPRSDAHTPREPLAENTDLHAVADTAATSPMSPR